jgi:hypothetical protein
MRLLCLDVPQAHATPEQYAPLMDAEVRHGWALLKSGLIRDIYFRQDRPGVAILAEADSVEDARAQLATFPLAAAGLIDWDVIPLGPMLNWERLFAPA